MESIVFFGKGGIGKSTIASNITVLLAAGGGKVLHVGCDPKMDSTLSLMGRHIQPFTAKSGNSGEAGLRESIYPSKVPGVQCIEAGGPQPGVGCAGTGIGSMLDAMKDGSLLEDDGYTAAVFDVLGDVVCGGFAAPLRRGFAKKAVIVTSEEPLSLYSANRLIMMIDSYARNGVYLAGLAVNAKTPEGARRVENFARAVNTRVLGVILRDRAVTAAEHEHRPAVLAHPQSEFTRRAALLCSAIRAAGAPKTPPRAMQDADFFAFTEGRQIRTTAKPGLPAAPAQKAGAGRGQRSAVSLFAGAGITPSGMEGGQIICQWKSSKGVLKIVISRSSAAQQGMTHFSDWSVCFHPSVGKDTGMLGSELKDAAEPLAALRFDEMLSTFMGMKDFYGGLTTYMLPDDKQPAAGDNTSLRQHIGTGQWRPFILQSGVWDAYIPPGSLMVEHGDSECRFCTPEDGVAGMFSESAGLKSRGRLTSRGPLLPRGDQRVVNTDFQTSDAIFGDEATMLRSLNSAASRTGTDGLVEFYVGCSAMMLASDAEAFSRRVEKEKGVKVVLENYNSFYEHKPEKTKVRVEFMAKRLARARGKKTCDVNLVNFGWIGAELAGLLTDRGLSLVQIARKPGQEPSQLRWAPVCREFYSGARSARLQVLAAPDMVLGPAFEKAGMQWLLPPAPYGFSGTSSWLSAIAGALRRKGIQTGPTAAQKTAALELFRRARTYTAGFVVTAGELGMLAEGTVLKTVPVLPVLAEAGFRVRLFVVAEDGSGASRDGKPGERPDAAKKARAHIAALRTAVPGLRVTADFLKTADELHGLLRADKALRLVYSDIRRDPRVVSAGKTPFSAALFQPGYAGALETWRHLLELCEWDFNERYLSTK